MHSNIRFALSLVATFSVMALPTRVSAQVQPTGVGLTAVQRAPDTYTTFDAPRVTRFVMPDSTRPTPHHATFIGGTIGGIFGGLGAAAYALNAAAPNCVTIGPLCPSRHSTGRVVGITAAGVVVGGALGAWLGHAIRL